MQGNRVGDLVDLKRNFLVARENFVAWVSDIANKNMSFSAVAADIIFLAFMGGGREG